MRHQRAAPLFAALGDPTRLAIVTRLHRHGPQSITQLTASAAITRQAITKHLQVLARVKLVRNARQGREQIWTLHPQPLETLETYLHQINTKWDAALARLRTMVEQQ